MNMTTAQLTPANAPTRSKPQGELYRRYDEHLGLWFSLRTLDIDADLALFNRWQNTTRVAPFWDEQGSLDEHRAYLQKIADTPHIFSVIGCFNDEPFAYYEVYWALDDRIAPFFPAGEFDRGIHMLVGEEHHRGPAKVDCWLRSLVDWLLRDEPRTCRVVAEPRADNDTMIGYMASVGFTKHKEFDFPHKRAALMVLERADFRPMPLG
ncbi:acetyl CoA:N6-hydroxylysine acetyl transferase [Pseudomonas sp. JUb96]|nr:acetyl CoA:N6-hydroxylysine acetyl transferase [Pseudomonas sp. JUb96]